ncbi:hypothetical protein OZ13_17715 [Xanthomonas cannabis pv. cannabis]|nr:hypothetical protein OZ13_17715 [Xanthomonas cannabis pv. cannabis]KHL55778.1 hypothetical protein OZ10_10260 [Xanthomonas cannabis pv. cannabis]
MARAGAVSVSGGARLGPDVTGLTLGRADAYIAATAAAHGLAVATRDTAPFEAMTSEVIHPWN